MGNLDDLRGLHREKKVSLRGKLRSIPDVIAMRRSIEGALKPRFVAIRQTVSLFERTSPQIFTAPRYTDTETSSEKDFEATVILFEQILLGWHKLRVGANRRGYLKGEDEESVDEVLDEILEFINVFNQFSPTSDTAIALTNPVLKQFFYRSAAELRTVFLAFPEFHDAPWILRQVALHNPTDPESALRKVQATIKRLETAEEFAEFHDTPGLLRHAAVQCPNDPDNWLRKVQATVRRLETTEEFIAFVDAPWIFQRVAVSNPSNPEGALRKVQATVKRLETTEEFGEFLDTPRLFLKMVASNPSNPEGALRKVQATVKRLETAEEFAEFHETPGLLRHVAVNSPNDPEGALRKIQSTVQRLKTTDEFAEFQDTPGLLLEIASSNPNDPEGALRKVQLTVQRLKASEEFTQFCDTPWIFRQIAIYNPNDPDGALRKVQKAVRELEATEELLEFSDMPGLLRRIAVHKPRDPVGTLLKAQAALKRLKAAEEFAEFHDTPGLLLQVAVDTPRNPEGTLRKVQGVVKKLEAAEEFAQLRSKVWIFRQVAVHNPLDPEAALRKVLSTARRLIFAKAIRADMSAQAFIDIPYNERSKIKVKSHGINAIARAHGLSVDEVRVTVGYLKLAVLIWADDPEAQLIIHTRLAEVMVTESQETLRSKIKASFTALKWADMFREEKLQFDIDGIPIVAIAIIFEITSNPLATILAHLELGRKIWEDDPTETAFFDARIKGMAPSTGLEKHGDTPQSKSIRRITVERLITNHYSKLEQLARKVVFNDTADDILQEAVAAALQHADRFISDGINGEELRIKFMKWFGTILTHRAINTSNKRKKVTLTDHQSSDFDASNTLGSFISDALTNLELKQAMDALSGLTHVQRKIFEALFINGDSVEEVARELGMRKSLVEVAREQIVKAVRSK